jgi:aspartyl-tRNA synthetase
MFTALGMSGEEALHKFGFLLELLNMGRLHTEGSLGFDRLCAILGEVAKVYVILLLFQNNSGRDVMLDAPSTIDDKQFEELQIKLNLK